MKESHINNYLNYIQEIEPVTTALLAISAASLAISATNMFKSHFTKGSRQCSDLASKERSLCMLRAKAMAKKVQLAALKDGMNKCNKAKNPGECKSKLKNKHQKVASEVAYLNKRFNDAKKRV